MKKFLTLTALSFVTLAATSAFAAENASAPAKAPTSEKKAEVAPAGAKKRHHKKKEKEGTKTCYQMKITKAQFKQNKARAILKESYDGKISHFIAALTGDDAITDVDEQELLSQIKAIKNNS